MLNLENIQDSVILDDRTLMKIEEALDFVTTEEGVEYEPEVSVYFVDDEKIMEYNRMYREIDSSTDVLSFPALSYPEGNPFSVTYAEDENLMDYMFNEDKLMLGDVVISGDHIKSQALEYGHSEYRETIFLFVHSLLHLLGYDHMIAEDKRIMNEKEDYYMNMLGVDR
ncbi:MAG: rRNA maturation RNase YbeY [Clostridiaceae bacterium]